MENFINQNNTNDHFTTIHRGFKLDMLNSLVFTIDVKCNSSLNLMQVNCLKKNIIKPSSHSQLISV